jgi:hypothetical protein
VIMFSSPDDGLLPPGGTATCKTGPTETTRSAAWVSEPFATPLSRYYGLVSCTDPGFSAVETVWSDLDSAIHEGGLAGLGGPAVVVPAGATPTGTHQFWSELPTPHFHVPGLWQHDSTVLDSATPTCSGTTTPVLLPVWDEMLIGAGGLAGSAPRHIC